MARFEIEIFTRFREAGIADIGRRVRAELQRIANDRSLTPGQQAQRIGETRLGVERAISAQRSTALAGLTPGSAEYAAISRTFASARAQLVRAFREIETGSTTLGARLRAILARVGASLPTAAAVNTARGSPFGPVITDEAQKARERAQVDSQTQAILAADSQYIRNTAAAARSRAQIMAGVQRILAADSQYIGAQAAIGRAKAQIAAAVQQELSADRQYIGAQISLSRAKARSNAAVEQALSVDREYIAAQIQSARAKARQQAAVQAGLSADQIYIDAQISLARSKARQAASIQSGLAADSAYIAAQSLATRAKAQQQAAIAETLATDRRYSDAQATATRAKAVSAASVQAILAADTAYIAAQASAARSKAQQSAAIAQLLSVDRQYIAAQSATARAKARTDAATQQALAVDREYINAQAQAARAKARLAAATQAILAADQIYIEAQVSAARSKARQAASVARALAADAAYATAQAGATRAKAQQRARVAQILASDDEYAAAQLQTARTKAQQNARTQQALAADQAYITATAQATAAKRQLQSRIRAEVAAITGSTSAEEAAISAIRSRIVADRQATASARILANAQSALGREASQAAVARRAAEARVNAALHQQERAYVRAAIAAGEGTRFQRLMARYQFGGQARLPTELPTAGQFLGSRALTTVGYGLSGALLYGSLRAISNMVKEAQELEKVMNQVRRQFEEIGDMSQFGTARTGIMSIARETGIDAEKVGSSFRLLRGAYDDTREAQGATQVALRETRSAMQITAVTGLDLKETFDSLTATSLSFNISMEEIGNNALGLSERFGVPAKEIIQFTADIAPVAAELGFTAEQLAAVGAAAQRVSGRSGSSLAEAFARVIPQIQNVKNEILGLYQLPELVGNYDIIANAFATGDISTVFFQTVRDYDKLTKGQKAYYLELLGGRRETQALAAVLRNSGPLLRELDEQTNNAGRNVGKLANYFDDLRGTVQNTRERVAEAFRQLGDSLFRAGLAEVLITAAGAAGVLAGALQLVFGPLAALNEATGGIIGKFASWVIVSALLAKGMQIIASLVGRKAAATAAAAAATGADTAATGANAAAQGAQAAATQASAGAMGADTAATGANTTATAANTAATGANAAAQGAQAGATGAGAAGQAGRFLRFGPALSPFARIALPVAAAGVVLSQYNEKKGDTKKAEDALREKLAKASDEDLERIANQRTGMFDRVAVGFFGGELPEKIAAKQIQKNRAELPATDLRALFSTGLVDEYVNAITEQQFEQIDKLFADEFSSKQPGKPGELVRLRANSYKRIPEPPDEEFNAAKLTKERIESIIQKALTEGDPFNVKLLELLREFAKTNPELQRLLDEAMGVADEVSQAKAVGGLGALSGANLEQTRQKFETGAIGPEAMEDALKKSIARLEDLQRRSGIQGDGGDGGIGFTPKDEEELNRQRKELRDFFLTRVKDQLGAAERLRRLTGQDSAAATFADIQRALTAGSSLDLKSKLELLPDAMTALEATFQEELDKIKDPVERYARAKEGFKIPDFIQVLVIAEQINLNPEITAFVAEAANYFNTGLQDMTQKLAEALLVTQGNLKEAVALIFDEQIKKLWATAPTDTERQIIAVGKEADEIERRKQEALAKFGDITVPTPGSRGGLSRENLENLREQAEKAEDDADDRAKEAARARIDLLKAQHGKDPVALAQLEIEAANLAAAQAETEADALQAEAQRINAMRQLEDAQLDLFASLQEYYAAIAGAAGDAVAVSELELGTVRERLRVLTAQGFGDTAEANRLRAEIVRSEAAVRDAKFQDQLGDIDYLLELEKISTGQAIEMLRAMMQIPTNTEEMNRTLERRIRALTQELSQDFQFNLPTELKLPTLYEVRRLAQTAQGQSYQDNRQIQINFQANNVADAQAIAQGIADTFAQPSRFGTLPKRY